MAPNIITEWNDVVMHEKFKDTEGIIRFRKSNDRQWNTQKKKKKKVQTTNNDLQNMQIKWKIEQHESH